MSRRTRTIGVLSTVIGVAALSLWTATAGSADGASSSARGTAASQRVLAPATPTMITFAGDAVGDPVPEPFTSRNNPTVHFRDSDGSNLEVGDFDDQSDGIGLAVNGDDPSALAIRFDVPTTKVSILFGNDDECCSSAGDVATLIVYRNGVELDSLTTVMNRDDIANQRVTYTGEAVDRARFVYTTDTGLPIDLIEIVDDIIIAPVCSISGGAQANILTGTPASDGICGKAGADTIRGKGGNDWISGAVGNDLILGGPGGDLAAGLDGRDEINVADGVHGNDTIFAGPGVDRCLRDRGDVAIGCETLITKS